MVVIVVVNHSVAAIANRAKKPKYDLAQKMMKENSDVGNVGERCPFDNFGYCKFETKCKKQHFENVCENIDCDKKCPKRHPKTCKFGRRCKFLKKNVCSFSQSNLSTELSQSKCDNLKKEIEELKGIIEKQKIENDNKINGLKNESEVERKINNKIVAENNELHKLLKVEMNEIGKKVEKLKKSNEYLEERIIIMIKKENQNTIENLKESQQKGIEKSLKEALTATETIKAKNKSKPKKITQEDREEEVIVEFEKDGKEILETRINCGLKLDEIHCKRLVRVN